ncbi:hypothetical protein BJ742DRAFT_852333 [Cladochytrium replicatum]|nr:hypothetical protein BJ742DRAFT_852333 [Cladochytrium replicatum]
MLTIRLSINLKSTAQTHCICVENFYPHKSCSEDCNTPLNSLFEVRNMSGGSTNTGARDPVYLNSSPASTTPSSPKATYSKDETLPTYENVLDENKLPEYIKGSKKRSKIICLGKCVGIIVLLVAIAIVIAELIKSLRPRHPKEPALEEITLSMYNGIMFGNATIGNDTARHLVGYDDFAIGLFDSYKSFFESNNGAPHLVIVGKDGHWFNSIDNNTKITQIAPYNSETLVALSSSNNITSLVQIRFARTLGPFQAYPVASMPLTNITSPSFNYPIVDVSIHLSRSTISSMLLAVVDKALTTWIYRIKLPEFTIELTSYADLNSNSMRSSILMLTSVTKSFEHSFALLVPRDLSLVYYPETQPNVYPSGGLTEFLGPASRGTLSRDGSYLTIMGDRAKIAGDVNTNSANYHRFTVNLDTWAMARMRVNASLYDVSTASSNSTLRPFTVEGLESRVDVSGLVNSIAEFTRATKNSLHWKVESIVSNSAGFYALWYSDGSIMMGGVAVIG